MASFAIFFLTLLMSILRIQAEPLPQDQPLTNGDCIEMNDEKSYEIKQIIQELTDFIDILTSKYEDIDLRLIKLNIEKYVESNEDTQTILELSVNDCGKRSESYNFSGEFISDHQSNINQTNDSLKTTEAPQANESQINSNTDTEGSSTAKHVKKSNYHIISKQENDNGYNNHMDQTTIVNVIRKKKSSGNIDNYEKNTSVDKASFENSNLNTKENSQPDQHIENTSDSNQEQSKTVVNSEDSPETDNVSTTTVSNDNNNDKITSNNKEFSEHKTSVTDFNQSTININYNKESNEHSETAMTSNNNDQPTGHANNNNENDAKKISQSTGYVENNAYADKSTQSANNNVDVDKFPQNVETNNGNIDKHSQSKNNNYVEKNNFYKDKFTSKNETKEISNYDNNNLNERYNTAIDNRIDLEESQLLKSLRQLIRREVAAVSGTADNNAENNNYDSTDIEDNEKYYDLDNAVKPQLVRIVLPDDVLQLKYNIDRKRGKKPSQNPMLVYLKQSYGQQIIIL